MSSRKKRSAPKGRASNLNYGLAQEKKVAKDIVTQNGGRCISMRNKKMPIDLLHIADNGHETGIQVKSSRPKSKGTNKISREEKNRLKQFGRKTGIDVGVVQKKGNTSEYTQLN